ncbi:MAG: hypothetical protein LBV43_04045 [Prevotella sp.]|jgi:hypothetical protein|nr:hypothetical protein [Prevotella sp.]
MIQCPICKEQKGYHRCLITDQIYCASCCVKTQSWERCNTECEYFKEELLNYKPFNTHEAEITALPKGEVIRFETPLFLPNIFQCIQCNVAELNIFILDFNKIKVEIRFKLEPIRILGEELYKKDSWKIKSSNVPFRHGKALSPLIIIGSAKSGVSNLKDNKYQYGDCSVEAIKSSYSMHIWEPHTKSFLEKVDTRNKPEFDSDSQYFPTFEGKMSFCKCDIYWGEFSTKFEHKFSFLIESLNVHVNENRNILSQFGICLPYKSIAVDKFSLSKSSEFKISDESFLALQTFGQQKVTKMWETPLIQNWDNMYHGGYAKVDYNRLNSPFKYNIYCFADFFTYLVPSKSILSSLVCESDYIVSAYFNCFKELYENKYSPINLVITNTSFDIQKIKIEYFIEGITNLHIENIFIEAKSTNSIPILPTILEDKLSNMTEHNNAHLNIKVFKDNVLVHEESKIFNLLPKETFIYDNEDNGESKKLYFYSLLARWVTPNNSVIDKIINETSKTTEYISGDSTNASQYLAEIKAIYNTISKYVKYVSRTFSLYKGKTSLHQKVHLPENTIKNESGNCIDLTVLMASCLEKIGYNPLLIIVPGHAYLGVKLESENLFIETTLLGYNSFEEALALGLKNTEEHFSTDLKGTKKERCTIIDVFDARKNNIYPMN